MSIQKNLIALAALAMSACSMVQTTAPAFTTAAVPGIAAVDAEIVEAVDNANRANALDVEFKPRKRTIMPEGATLPSVATQLVDVNWNGPIEGLLEDLAGRAGFEFAVTGDAPEESPVIELVTRNEPLFGVAVRSTFLVSGDVVLAFDPATTLLELRWLG